MAATPETIDSDVMANVKTLRDLPSGHGIKLVFFMTIEL
jgi:hypothetical protein